MFLLKHDPEATILDFEEAIELYAIGKADDARMWITDIIENANPEAIWFAKNLDKYMNHDQEFAPDAIALMEIHNDKSDFALKNKERPQPQIQPQSKTQPKQQPQAKQELTIQDKLGLAVAIQELLKKEEPIATESEPLKARIINFLNKELQFLFGEDKEEKQETLTNEEIRALKLLARKIL